ncbi:MAG: hypothetical protein LBV40_08205 [Methanomicrobiales archaeon]|nr:hypothetical protein [Methanomicrobiales archaeon]
MAGSHGIWRFKYGTDPNLDVSIMKDAEVLWCGSQLYCYTPSPFNLSLSGLTPGTTYYFQACGLLQPGYVPPYVCGNILSFITPLTPTPTPVPVGVVVRGYTNLTSTSATLRGEITDMAGEPNTVAFFKYSTSMGLEPYTRVEAGTLTSPGIFYADISSLSTGILHFFLACATTSTGDTCCTNGYVGLLTPL